VPFDERSNRGPAERFCRSIVGQATPASLPIYSNRQGA